jgi:Uma2 family endonuclease
MIEGADGFVELAGSADMVLEVVSKNSVTKDTRTLRDLYWKAEVPEFWLVDARGSVPFFEILARADDGYQASPGPVGWQKSKIFNKSFQINKSTNPLGHPLFTMNFTDTV